MTTIGTWIKLSVFWFVFAIAVSAHAEIKSERLLELTDNYREQIESRVPDRSIEDVLITLKAAQIERNSAEIIKLSEELVVLGNKNAQSWLNLSKAWLGEAGVSAKGLAASIRAFQLANDRNQRIEALLTASNFLRRELSAKSDVQENQLKSQLEDKLYLERIAQSGGGGDFAAPDPNNQDGKLRSVDNAIRDLERDIAITTKAIQSSLQGLDAVYSELIEELPGLAMDNLQKGDARPILTVAQETILVKERTRVISEPRDKIEYKVANNEIHACIKFTRQLSNQNHAYNSHATLFYDGDEVDPSDYALIVSDDFLCLTGLAEGEYYKLVLDPLFPAADGALLGEEREVNLEIPRPPCAGRLRRRSIDIASFRRR